MLHIQEDRIHEMSLDDIIERVCNAIELNGACHIRNTIKDRNKEAVMDPYFVEFENLCEKNKGKKVDEYKAEVSAYVYRLATR